MIRLEPAPVRQAIADVTGFLMRPWPAWFQELYRAFRDLPISRVVSQTLIAATTEIQAPEIFVDGDRLTVFLLQDAAGGRNITWSSGFRYASTAIDTTPLTTSVFEFVARQEPGTGIRKWFMTAMLTGQL